MLVQNGQWTKNRDVPFLKSNGNLILLQNIIVVVKLTVPLLAQDGSSDLLLTLVIDKTQMDNF